MLKSPQTISARKFAGLSLARRHGLLAELAQACRNGELNYDSFLQRYQLMHQWSELDRFQPPSWLSPTEALQEFYYFHLGFSNRPEQMAPGENLSWQPRFPVEVVLDQVRSPYNVGSSLRLIDNFGFESLVHAGHGLRLDHPQLCRAARGAQAWVPVRREADLMAYLSRDDRLNVGVETDPEAVPLDQWEPALPCRLILGNESYGLAQAVRQKCDILVSIPLFGFKKSMNVHHAFAVVGQRIVEKGSGLL